MKKLIFVIVIIFVFGSCNTISKKDNFCLDLQKDTIFYKGLPEDAREILFSQNQAFFNKMLNNIYISIYENRNKYHFIIKEFGKDSIKRFYYFQEKIHNINTEYDSSGYDSKVFVKKDLENNLFYANKLSFTFFNIHKLRKNDKWYQSYFKENKNKLTEIENIVNNMDVFKNFSLKNSYQVGLLKEFLFITRMSTLNYDENNTTDMTLSMFNFNSIGNITTENFYEFEKCIDYLNLDYDKKNLVSYWKHQNSIFLTEKKPMLKENLKEKGSFILFTRFPETKVFLYNISVKNHKIKLKETYINKNYYWFHPYYGISIPAVRM